MVWIHTPGPCAEGVGGGDRRAQPGIWTQLSWMLWCAQHWEGAASEELTPRAWAQEGSSLTPRLCIY